MGISRLCVTEPIVLEQGVFPCKHAQRQREKSLFLGSLCFTLNSLPLIGKGNFSYSKSGRDTKHGKGKLE